MGSVLPGPCSGGAPRTPSVGWTVWVVVVVLAGMAVATGQELSHEYDYFLPNDDQHGDTANASDSLLSQRQSFAARYFKCRCEGNQVWNGSQCSGKQTNVSVMIPDTQRVHVSLTDDFAGVTVRDVQCPLDYAELLLEPVHSSSYQFTLLPNGALSWQQSEYHHYCLEHTLDAQGEQTWEARLCIPPPSVPRCCPKSSTLSTEIPSCSDNLTLPFSPPISIGENFIEWPRLVEKIERKCNQYEKSLNLSLNSGESNLLYESGEVFIVWKTAHHIKKNQKDGFCVTPQEGGGYVATVCYEDHDAIHRDFCSDVTCVRKCCPKGEIHMMSDCVPAESSVQLWKPTFYDGNNLSRIPLFKDFHMLYGPPQCPMYLADPEIEGDKFYLLENGFLFTPDSFVKDPPNRYCVDSFLNTDNTVSTKALICFADPQAEPMCTMAKKTLYPVLLLVSSAFLGITIVIYLSMPDLRNKLHGRCLISLATAFFVSYLLMAISYLSDNPWYSPCIALGFFKHFTLLAAFFWLNIMCFDIWRTLRKTRVIYNGQWALRRFLWYSLYSWGCPLVIALAAVVVQLLPPSYNIIRPNFSNDACWFSDTAALWVYLYMWISLVVVANVVFFGLVVVILVKGQNNSLLRRSREVNRERMWLYVKLFLVMGVTWIAEMISYQSGKCVGWIFTDIINALQGLTLFLVFILSRSTLRKIKERWCCGETQSVLSPSNTLSSTYSSSSVPPKRLDASFKSSISSRFSNTSARMKGSNIESAIPLKTLSEAPEESTKFVPQKGNAQSIGREEEALILSNGDTERNTMMAKGDAASKDN